MTAGVDGLGHAGGCLCGLVRFSLDGAPRDAGWCHCGLCRRQSGAPAVVWGSWKADRLRLTAGAPSWYKSSEKAERGFCSACGSPMFYRRFAGRWIDVALGALDQPEIFPPQYHIWTGRALPWSHGGGDGLPRFEGDPPPGVDV